MIYREKNNFVSTVTFDIAKKRKLKNTNEIAKHQNKSIVFQRQKKNRIEIYRSIQIDSTKKKISNECDDNAYEMNVEN